MAKGKFSQPRTPRREEYELEQAFLQVSGSKPQKAAVPKSAPTEPFPEESSPTIEKNKKIRLIALCCSALVVIIGIIVTVCILIAANADDGLILNNVTVAGVNLGGMTPEEATAALHAATDQTYTTQDMVIELPDTTLNLSPSDTGVSLDVAAAVEAAYNHGRTGSREEKNAAKAQSLVGAYHIALLPYLNLDTEYIRQVLEEYVEGYNSDFMESSVEFEGEKPALEGDKFDETAPCQTLLLNAGSPARFLDIEDLYNQVLDAYSFNIFLVQIEESNPQQLPEALDLDAIFEEYCSDPVDAVMDMETFEVTPEVYGYTFDLEKAKNLLAEAEPGAVIGIPMEYVVPEVLSKDLSEKLFRDVLASCETPHTNDANRNTNLELACKAIDGYILNPGETFDYNEVLGKRTEEAGYKPAGAYNGGETVSEIGGGICQVSSTLYYCTLLADMEIVDRRSHSYVSTYIPMGMDAAVSWGGPEFRFQNNTDYPIRIEAEVSDGYVRIQILGTDEKDYYVEMEYKVVDYFTPQTKYEEYEPGNAQGYKDGQVIQAGIKGYTVYTYKCKYDKETKELLSRDYEATSNYIKRDEIIAKVKSAETESPETTEPPAQTETTQPPAEVPTDPPASDSGAETT